MKNNTRRIGKAKGFSLMELLVGMLIFSMIMITVSAVFTNSISGYRGVRNIQKNLENANYAISLMTKTLRTSTIVKYGNTAVIDAATGAVISINTPQNAQSLTVWDYSTGTCRRFAFDAAAPFQLKMSTGSGSYPSTNQAVDNLKTCVTDGFGAAAPIIGNPVQGNLEVINTIQTATGGRMGRVTISIEVCSNDQCAVGDRNKVTVEGSVSLRDFNMIGK